MGLVDLVSRVATGPRQVKARFTLPGVVAFLGMLTALAVVTHHADGWFGWGPFMGMGLRMAMGIPSTALGGTLATWCIIRFRKAHGTPVPLNPPEELVLDGLYARVRNPMMTGVFVAMFGLAFLTGSRALLLFGLPALIAAGVCFLKLIEEPELVRRFGHAYISYRSRVPMFLPRMWRADRWTDSGQADRLMVEDEERANTPS